MSTIAHKRKEAALFRIISEILTEEVSNSNVSYPTVTSVEYSRDGSHLTVFLTFESNPEKSIVALESAKGFVRSRLAKSSTLRKVPEIHFKIDDSIENGRKIERIIKEIHEKK